MTLAEKAAYIRGLAEGLELEADKKETRIINELLELVSVMANDVDDIGADLTELYEVVEEIDEELTELEEDIFEALEDSFGDDDEEGIYEITCPACGDNVVLDEDMLFGGDVICPNCGEKIEIEIDDECGCGEHHHHHE